MKPSKIIAVFLKDLKDILRDRKTLIFMILLPTALFPLLILGVSRFVVRAQLKREAQRVTIAMSPGDEKLLRKLIQERRQAYDPKVVMGLIETIKPGLGERLLEAMADHLEEDPGAISRLLTGETVDFPGLKALRGEIEEAIKELGERDVVLTPEQRTLVLEVGALGKLLTDSDFVDPRDGMTREGSGKAPSRESYPEWVRKDEGVLALARAISERKIHAAVVLPPDFEAVIRAGEEGTEAKIYYDSTIPPSQEAEKRIQGAVKVLGEGYLEERLAEKGLSLGFIRPVEVNPSNIAPKKKQVQVALAGFLPYIIILFCFLGAFYPALDLGAGEKERFTLETLLLSPASRFEIAAGKFLVILSSSLVAALLGLASMGFTLTKLLPPEVAAKLQLTIDPLALGACAFLAIPVASIFASILLSISIYARSFKEGQSYAAPLQILIILPALAALLPDIEISWKIALIPLVNVSLVMKEFMKGSYRWDFFAVTLLSTALLAALAITFAARWFNREQVIFRN